MSEARAAWLHDEGIGILLIGHGTREEAGQAEFLATASLLQRTLPGIPVQPAYLELAKPTIAEGWSKLAECGVRRIAAVPVLLFAAGHAKNDIPEALAVCSGRFGGLPFTQSEPLGCHPAIVEQSALRFREAVEAGQELSKIVLIMVGRGSLDADATAEMHRFATLRPEDTRPREVRVAFLAMAQPRLAEVLDQPLAKGITTVVVQPHLLFAGQLLGDVGRLVREASQRCPMIDWRVADHLGPTDLVADALIERVIQSIRPQEANGKPQQTVVEERV